jgi:hypothetical protein
VKEVALGEGGIIEGAKPGTVLIDMSSIAAGEPRNQRSAESERRRYAGCAGQRRRTEGHRRYAVGDGGR